MLTFAECLKEAAAKMGHSPDAGDEYTNAYAFYDAPAKGEIREGGDTRVIMKNDGTALSMTAYALFPDKDYVRSFIIKDGNLVEIEAE
ncbi:MAG: hypothetical protein ACI4ET_12685 [Bilifractor sp.]